MGNVIIRFTSGKRNGFADLDKEVKKFSTMFLQDCGHLIYDTFKNKDKPANY